MPLDEIFTRAAGSSGLVELGGVTATFDFRELLELTRAWITSRRGGPATSTIQAVSQPL